MTTMIVILYFCETLMKNNVAVANVCYNIIPLPLIVTLFLMPQVEANSSDKNKLDSGVGGGVWTWIAIACLVLSAGIVIANNVATVTRNDSTASGSTILPLHANDVASDLDNTNKKRKKMTVTELYEGEYGNALQDPAFTTDNLSKDEMVTVMSERLYNAAYTILVKRGGHT